VILRTPTGALADRFRAKHEAGLMADVRESAGISRVLEHEPVALFGDVQGKVLSGQDFLVWTEGDPLAVSSWQTRACLRQMASSPNLNDARKPCSPLQADLRTASGLRPTSSRRTAAAYRTSEWTRRPSTSVQSSAVSRRAGSRKQDLAEVFDHHQVAGWIVRSGEQNRTTVGRYAKAATDPFAEVGEDSRLCGRKI